MTLNDIGRMLKLAKVAQSKTVECLYPNPSVTIHVPPAQYIVVMEVVAKVKLPHQNINVVILDLRANRDVRAGEHVYVKVTGEIVDAPDVDWRERRITARMRNHGIVINCASVNAQ